MRKQYSIFAFIILFATSLLPYIALATTPVSISFFSEKILQGEPVMVTIDGLTQISQVKSLTFDKQVIPVFLKNNKVTAFIGIDLRKKPGDYPLKITLATGEVLEKVIIVAEREKIVAVFGIPEKLGGNTTASQDSLVAVLALENSTLNNLFTGTHAFWTKNFRFPLYKILVTDPYGYSRQTGQYSIAHKGTDFRAAEGTPVVAMNRGVVRIARTGVSYGKTIVIDHGLGVQTFYLHLSKIKVVAGQLVLPGQVIGLSGETGYADAPHLHLSIRINNVSVDPMKFMEFFEDLP